MYRGKRVLAIVPARGGSKGIPLKNLRKVGGVSLVGRVGNIVTQLSCIDRAVLSTDSEQIAEEGRQYGLETPFLRPADLAADTAVILDTVQYTVRNLEEMEGARYDIILLLEPTCPLRTAADVEETIERLVSTGADASCTVSPVPFHDHPMKVMVFRDGRFQFYEPQGEQRPNRQSLPPIYRRNGACYAMTRACLLEKNSLYGQHLEPIIIHRELANIDEPADLDYAEALLAR